MAHRYADGFAARFIVVIVDTNVLVDVLQDDVDWADWSVAQLRTHSQLHTLAINDIIYAELALTFDRFEDLDHALELMQIQVEPIPKPALFLAAKAFVKYRRMGGQKNNVLADFFVGAHAAVSQCQLLTRDTRRYKQYFPSVSLIAPSV